MHVRTAEPVDRLLGVPDQHERRIGVRRVEEGREDLPLDRIGVLELVDEHHGEPAPEGFDRALRAGAAQRVPQLGEHIVETEDPAPEAAPGDQIHGPSDQLAQELLGLGGAGLAPGRHEVEIGLPVGQRGGPVEDLQ